MVCQLVGALGIIESVVADPRQNVVPVTGALQFYVGPDDGILTAIQGARWNDLAEGAERFKDAGERLRNALCAGDGAKSAAARIEASRRRSVNELVAHVFLPAPDVWLCFFRTIPGINPGTERQRAYRNG